MATMIISPLDIRVNFRAVGEARPRVVTQDEKIRTYSPKSKERKALQYLLKEQCKKPIGGCLTVSITFAFKPPSSWSLKKQSQSLAHYKSTKPDIDNLIKFVLDAGNEVLWEDDRQIVELRAMKIYAVDDYIKIRVRQEEYHA